jgi:hypothetical protein
VPAAAFEFSSSANGSHIPLYEENGSVLHWQRLTQ